MSYQIPKKVTEEYAFDVDYVRKLSLHLTGEFFLREFRNPPSLLTFSYSIACLPLTNDIRCLVRWMDGSLRYTLRFTAFVSAVVCKVDLVWRPALAFETHYA